jgi:hypothetical protein
MHVLDMVVDVFEEARRKVETAAVCPAEETCGTPLRERLRLVEYDGSVQTPVPASTWPHRNS